MKRRAKTAVAILVTLAILLTGTTLLSYYLEPPWSIVIATPWGLLVGIAFARVVAPWYFPPLEPPSGRYLPSHRSIWYDDDPE